MGQHQAVSNYRLLPMLTHAAERFCPCATQPGGVTTYLCNRALKIFRSSETNPDLATRTLGLRWRETSLCLRPLSRTYTRGATAAACGHSGRLPLLALVDGADADEMLCQWPRPLCGRSCNFC